MTTITISTLVKSSALFILFSFATELYANTPFVDADNAHSDVESQIHDFKDRGDLSKIADVISKYHYLAPPPRYEVIEKLDSSVKLDTYLSSLDPHSRFIPKERYKFYAARNDASRIGAGFDLLVGRNNLLLVPFAQGPLAKQGMAAPRYLQFLNGKKVHFDDFDSYGFLANLQKGETVDVKLFPVRGSSPDKINYKVKADLFTRWNASTHNKGKDTIVSIHSFMAPDAARVFSEALQANTNKSLMIDLRYSTGGDVYEMIDAVSYLIPAHSPVLTMHSEQPDHIDSIFTYDSVTVPVHLKPQQSVTILVSEFTASAAEVFVRVVKHYLPKTRIIGMPTSGKCLAQYSYQLDGGDILQISRYDLLPPDKKSCEGKPIQPDTLIKNIELMTLDEVFKHL